MRTRGLLLLTTSASTAVIAGWAYHGAIRDAWAGRTAAIGLSEKPVMRPEPETYATLAAELARWKGDLGKRYAAAGDEAGRKKVAQDARVILEKVLPAMMRCWLGTPWDFNGTAARPGEGRIACGYFVATVLKDAGFAVDRYSLAQQPSENILRTFLPKKACVLTVGQEYRAFAEKAMAGEAGIYLLGLDTHVGFLVVEDGRFRMLHSSGSRPWCVVDEGPADAVVLQRSNWRLLGNLTGDDEVVRQWLRGETFVVHGTDD